MEFLTIILIGISLSMDAFSLSVCYGTLNFENKKIYLIALIVGVYHFIMPQIGMRFGYIISRYLFIDINIMVFIIFSLLGVEMINGVIKNKKNIILLNTFGILIFGFSVSVDSFSAGIGLEFITSNHILCSIIFSVFSMFFTILGLKIGVKLSEKFKKLAPLFGGAILITLAFIYLLN